MEIVAEPEKNEPRAPRKAATYCQYVPVTLAKKPPMVMTIDCSPPTISTRKIPYPLHIGITEAGTPRAGVIRSTVGIGTLLYLGIKDIRLGPSLPAFVTPNILNILVEKFDIKPISTPEDDLKVILG